MKLRIVTGLLFILGIGVEQFGGEIVISSAEILNNEPVYVDVNSGTINSHVPLCLQNQSGVTKAAQIEVLNDGTQRLWWIENMPASTEVSYNLLTGQNCSRGGGFYWKRVREDATRLMRGAQPVIQYEHPDYDLNNIEGTSKPFHHAFDPSGGNFITKGPGGLYTHHRGIFYGYYLYTGENRIEKSKNNEILLPPSITFIIKEETNECIIIIKVKNIEIVVKFKLI